MLPIEAEIHLKALTLFGNITRANKTSVEWRLAERQLQLKTHTSKSWFIQIKKICLKYDLPDCQNFLTYPLGKFQWKKLITRKIYTYWREKINENSEGYSSLQHIACAYKIKTIHPILTTNTSNCRDINRIPIRTKWQQEITYCNQIEPNSTNVRYQPPAKFVIKKTKRLNIFLSLVFILNRTEKGF
ncbi:unnamed protein product [Mytilus edulis]|uniref:Uncharacterized protein n=1 Tax=Mytilus edulis TaxID=6550 RepID=A0A8S3S6L5_MYTED|nr:unnamed protein product [Mytilus edulis]